MLSYSALPSCSETTVVMSSCSHYCSYASSVISKHPWYYADEPWSHGVLPEPTSSTQRRVMQMIERASKGNEIDIDNSIELMRVLQ